MMSESSIEKDTEAAVDLKVVRTTTGKRIIGEDADVALEFVKDEVKYVIDPEAEKRLVRKIDMYIIPIMCLLYSCQFLDKNSNSYAAIMGLRTDLKMVGQQYSWTSSAFYLGYLFFEYPAVRFLQRFPVVKTLGFFFILWGIIVCLCSIPSYAGFVTLRTLLGCAEAAITPAFVIITGQWYKKEEQFTRTSIWYSFNGLGTILAGSISYGLVNHDNYSLATWKVLFIIVGCMTIFLGIITVLHLPDIPTDAWFLNDDEKRLAVERIRSNNQGFGNKHFKWYQFVEAFKDTRTYILFFQGIAANIPNGGVSSFRSILLKTDLGYDTTGAMLMGMPVGAVELIGASGCGLLIHLIPHSLAIAIGALCIGEMSVCMFAFSTNHNARLAGLYLMAIAVVGTIVLLSNVSSNIAGHTKKTTVNAIYLIGYCVGNLIGPQTFRSSQAPSYPGAKVALVVCYAVCIFLTSYLYYYQWSENKRRDATEDEIPEELKSVENIEFADLTDRENPYFRYQL